MAMVDVDVIAATFRRTHIVIIIIIIIYLFKSNEQYAHMINTRTR